MAGFRLGSARLAVPRHAIPVGAAGLVLTLVIGFAAKAIGGPLHDSFAVDRVVHGASFPGAKQLALALDLLDRPVVVIVILLAVLVGFGLWRGLLAAFGAVAATGIGWVLCLVPKYLVREPRPAGFSEFAGLHEAELSYPSGHVTFVVALAVALGVLLAGSRLRLPIAIVVWVVALLTGWSRLFLGVHYPIDLLGALIGGVSGTLLVLGLWNRFAPGLLARWRIGDDGAATGRHTAS